MNETTKTVAIVGIGAALLFGGIYFLPSKANFTVESKVNEILFPALLDGNAAKGMEIVSFDEKLSALKKFEIKKENNGRWVLPSHNNYPADAKQQLVNAASSLVGLKALDQTEGNPEKHEVYGVLDPTDSKVKVGSIGVGKLVTFVDGGSNPLAKIIIGKQQKEMGKENVDSDLRYVRIAGQDPIYTVKLPTDKFSPKFEDWIETDLLKINEFDIREVELRDYVIRPEDPTNPILEKSDALLTFDDQQAKWSLQKLVEISEGKENEIKLTDKDELNTVKLNELKTALNDLKIVNVFRKPQGLINTLRGQQASLDKEASRSLAERGFYLVPTGNGVRLMSRDGEVVASLRDGVEYTLRFGDFADTLGESDEPEAEGKDQDKKTAPKTATKINRFLMVEARFNPDLITKPMLEEVPPEPAPAPAEKKDDKKEDPKPAEPKKVDAAKPEPSKEPAKDDKQSGLTPSPFRTAAFQPPAKEAEKKPADDKAPPAKQPAAEATKEEPKPADAKPSDAKAADAAKPDEAKPADANEAAARAEAEFERKRILRENEAKQKEYDTKVQDGQRKAKLLNERFAEWYYVIPDEVYRKIHLGKNDIIIPVKGQPGETPNPLKIPGLQGLPPGFPPPGLIPGGK